MELCISSRKSLQSRRSSLPAASKLDHRCPPPVRFHHVGWQSLGVRRRPSLASFVRHVENNCFCMASRTVHTFPFFEEYPGVSCIFFFQFPSTRNCRHEERPQNDVFCCVFLVGYWWINAWCCVVCANSWCRGLQVLFLKQ